MGITALSLLILATSNLSFAEGVPTPTMMSGGMMDSHAQDDCAVESDPCELLQKHIKVDTHGSPLRKPVVSAPSDQICEVTLKNGTISLEVDTVELNGIILQTVTKKHCDGTKDYIAEFSDNDDPNDRETKLDWTMYFRNGCSSCKERVESAVVKASKELQAYEYQIRVKRFYDVDAFALAADGQSTVRITQEKKVAEIVYREDMDGVVCPIYNGADFQRSDNSTYERRTNWKPPFCSPHSNVFAKVSGGGINLSFEYEATSNGVIKLSHQGPQTPQEQINMLLGFEPRLPLTHSSRPAAKIHGLSKCILFPDPLHNVSEWCMPIDGL